MTSPKGKSTGVPYGVTALGFRARGKPGPRVRARLEDSWDQSAKLEPNDGVPVVETPASDGQMAREPVAVILEPLEGR